MSTVLTVDDVLQPGQDYTFGFDWGSLLDVPADNVILDWLRDFTGLRNVQLSHPEFSSRTNVQFTYDGIPDTETVGDLSGSMVDVFVSKTSVFGIGLSVSFVEASTSRVNVSGVGPGGSPPGGTPPPPKKPEDCTFFDKLIGYPGCEFKLFGLSLGTAFAVIGIALVFFAVGLFIVLKS